mgnify:CR=1 FL=1
MDESPQSLPSSEPELPTTGSMSKRRKIIKRSLTLFVVLLLLMGVRQVWPYLIEPEPEVLIAEHQITEVADGLGSPSCLHWMNETWLLVCDRDGRLLALEMNAEGEFTTQEAILSDLSEPHGVLVWSDSGNGTSRLFISEKGELNAWNIDRNSTPLQWNLTSHQTLVSGVPTSNHQTNAVMSDGEDGLIWHAGSTCNICDEEDERNAALLGIDPWSGEVEILASGVRNSFDGTWVPDVGYVFTDNGRDWEGDHPPEELNLLSVGSAYGWPDDDPDHPVPEGTLGPISEFESHSSANGIDWRPLNSTLPGGPTTVYVALYGSWNTVVPVGQQILQVDIIADPGSQQGWRGESTVVVEDLATPLALKFHPYGDLYYAEYAHGTLYRLSTT